MTIIAAAVLVSVFAGAVPTPPQNEPPSEARVNPSQPDFTLVALPTTLRVPVRKSGFRVTHRFTRELGRGDFGDLASDLFGLDSSALIGLEFRFGVLPGGQIGVHRTNDRTIALFGQYDVIRQGRGRPLGVAAVAAVDGTNNFRDEYSPALGIVVSRELGRHGAVYVEPLWVGNVNVFGEPDPDNASMLVGLGTRLRIRPSVYVVAEFSPRVWGFSHGAHQASFAIEKRVGGHAFQLNVSNAFGTTFSQIARGGHSHGETDWYLGFNISRKFF